MSNLAQQLHLKYDPFDPGAPPRELFVGKDRQTLLTTILSELQETESLLAITGELGGGKSTFTRLLTAKMSKQTQVVIVQAGLFMNLSQFMDEVNSKLLQDDSATFIDRLQVFAAEGKSLLLVVDDAHELAIEVLEQLWQLQAEQSALRVLLLGEKQLNHLVEHSKPRKQRNDYKLLELLPLSSEDAFAYIEFKLTAAGFRQSLPLSGGELGQLYNKSAGNPAKLDTLVREALAEKSVTPPLRSALAGLFAQTRLYWSVAAGLCVLLLLVLMLDGSSAPANTGVGNQQVRISVPTVPDSTRSAMTTEVTTANPNGDQEPAATTTPVAPSQPVALADNASGSVTVPNSSPSSAPNASLNSASGAPEPAVASDTAAPSAPQANREQGDLTPFESAVLAAPADSYLVQMMGSRSRPAAEQFVSERLAGREAGVITSSFQGDPWYVVVLGVFADRQAAQSVLQALPASLRELNPWARPSRDFQAQLRSQ